MESVRSGWLVLLLSQAAFALSTPALAADVVGLVLIDADADVAIAEHDPLLDGAVVNLATLPTRNLNVRADVDAPVGSVRFSLDGVADYRTENTAPYALEGDNLGDYNPWTPTVGVHDLTATPYIGPSGTGGVAGAAMGIRFTVIDQLGNLPPTADAGPDQFLRLPANSTVLPGAGIDIGGTIVEYRWTQLSGPAATLIDAATATLTVADLVEASYDFRLVVVDDLGADGADEVTVTLAQPGRGFVTGELRLWHRVSVTFDGPPSGESADPNPFLDYRCNVRFEHVVSSTVHDVPCYYAADGAAAETSAIDGNKWRVHFSPDVEGAWVYTASFRAGSEIAVDPDPLAGTPTGFDGTSDSFVVGPSDKAGRDLRGQGQLRYVGERYLRFAGSGRYFLKGGADSPENFLGYVDFDNTQDNGGANNDLVDGVHHFAPHVADWRPGDPSWQAGKGKGIIGALNYLATTGMNSVYFLTMNVQGDGREVYPWTTYDADFTRFDCSKLDQWEVVFEHMTQSGIQLHVLLQETENDQLLDNGDLGRDRRLYYRELVARFAHHPALQWNLGEETSRTRAQHEADSTYLKGLDPYRHAIVLHTFPGAQEAVYGPLLGWPDLDGPSIQIDGNANSHARTIEWMARSAAAGHPWFASLDEQGPANAGVVPDADDFWHDGMRQDVLWGNLIGGGAGVEWYFGYNFPHSDLDCEDWRSRDHMWTLTRLALDFFHAWLPFPSMSSRDDLVAGGNWCLAEPSAVYAVYLPNGGTTTLDLSAAPGAYSVRWFDPRVGGPLQIGSLTTVPGGGLVGLGDPPSDLAADWVALVRRGTHLHRGPVADLTGPWKPAALPLTSVNDDETAPFPLAAVRPGAAVDGIATAAPLVLYRLLTDADGPAGNVLRAVAAPGSGVVLSY